MNISKTLVSCLIMLSISIVIAGCNKSSSQISSLPVAETSPTPVEPVKAPEVYDVICFQAMGLAVSRTMCDPEQTYKILRNSKITISLDKKTSVQQGSYTVASYNYDLDRKREKITASEMESLASQSANIYTIYYNRMVIWGEDKHLIEVQLYNKDIGSFKMFDQSSSTVVFETGDTKARVELPPRKEGLMGDMQAVQNGGIYRKIVTNTQPATGSAGGKLDVTDKVKLVPLKTALVMTNSAIKGGDIDKAKTMFNKFSSLWLTVEPIVKSKAGDKYPAIEKDIATIETALGEANPDKVKAGEGLTAAIQRFNELMK